MFLMYLRCLQYFINTSKPTISADITTQSAKREFEEIHRRLCSPYAEHRVSLSIEFEA